MRSIVAVTIAASSVVTPAAQRVSAPPSDSLLELTQRAARESTLGDLQTSKTAGTDVELRFWAGYGTAGTHGLILRRHSGAWTSTLATIEDCTILVPTSRGRDLTDAQRAAYEQRALKRCDTNPPSLKGSVYIVTASRLRLQPARLDGDLTSLWTELLSNGLAELPPRVPRGWLMFDGHTFVVELRTADEYRASVIECTKPEAPADTHVQRIAALLFERLPSASWLKCIHE